MSSLSNLSQAIHLIEEDPSIEADLFLIIKAYEDKQRKEGGEIGIIASTMGELKKGAQVLDNTVKGIDMFGGLHALDNAKAELDKKNPFSHCLPCQGRLLTCNDHLPMPGFMSIFKNIEETIKKMLEQFELLLDPGSVYIDLCELANAVKTLCPNDIALMISSLIFSLSNDIFALIKLDFDFMSIVGALLFPLGMFSLLLFDGIKSISKVPMDCVIQSFTALQSTIDSINTIPQALNDFEKNADFGIQTKETNRSVKVSTSIAPTAPKVPSLTKLTNKLQQGNDFIEKYYELWRNATETIVNMFGEQAISKLSISVSIVELIRTIKLIEAIAKAIDTTCTDVNKPLTDEELQSIIDELNPNNKDDGLIDSSVGDNGSTIKISINSGTLSVSDLLTGKVTSVPTCINSTSNSMNQWIQELNGV